MNQYKYETLEGYTKGFFNIYQARNGKIMLMMGNGFTSLTMDQIDDLNINVYNLKDFNKDDFDKAYNLLTV